MVAKKVIEMASVVFKESSVGDKFEVLKTRDRQLKLGGVYSEDLVEFYAKNNEGVVVLDFSGDVVGEPAPLKVGDYVKIVKSLDGNEGTIAKIIGENVQGYDFELEFIPKSVRRRGAFTSQLIHATDEEVAEAKRQQAEKAVAAKWASINRKPNEFKKGDIVEIIDYENGLHVGTLAEVRYVNSAAVGVNGVKDGEFCTCYVASLSAVKLVAPVESRV